jgi:integrase
VPFREIEMLPKPRRRRRASVAELTAIWGALDAFEAMPSFAPLVRLLALTGCRLNEWRRALWSWVDLDAGVLRLPDSKVGPRDIALPPEAVAILRALPRSSVYVLPGRLGGPMMGVHDTWYRFLASVGVSNLRFHDLRRTHGSMALESGLTVRKVADLLGHADVRSTEVYLASESGHQAESVRHVAGEIVRLATGGAKVVESITNRRAVSTK